MTSSRDPASCSLCSTIATPTRDEHAIERARARLGAAGRGSYYRGSEGQLTEFELLRCPACGTHYEAALHFYSDPESTMGLGRDESSWRELTRLDAEVTRARLAKVR